MGKVSVIPEAGDKLEYKEAGGLTWCVCEIIAVHKGKVWVDNLSSGSQPVGKLSKFMFRKAGTRTDQEKLIDELLDNILADVQRETNANSIQEVLSKYSITRNL